MSWPQVPALLPLAVLVRSLQSLTLSSWYHDFLQDRGLPPAQPVGFPLPELSAAPEPTQNPWDPPPNFLCVWGSPVEVPSFPRRWGPPMQDSVILIEGPGLGSLSSQGLVSATCLPVTRLSVESVSQRAFRVCADW